LPRLSTRLLSFGFGASRRSQVAAMRLALGGVGVFAVATAAQLLAGGTTGPCSLGEVEVCDRASHESASLLQMSTLKRSGGGKQPNETTSEAVLRSIEDKPIPDLPIAVCNAAGHYECGRQVGKQMKKHIRRAVRWYSDLVKFCNGNALCDKFIDVNNASYPHLVEEVEGMAKGAKVNPRKLLLMNIQEIYDLCTSCGDLSSSTSRSASGNTSRSFHQRALHRHRLGCTDYLLRKKSAAVMGHNEDSDSKDQDWEVNYLVDLNISGHRIIGYAYAGQLVGNAWGFNDAGLAVTMDSLSAEVKGPGLGTNFVGRHILQATCVADATMRAAVNGQAQGSSFNIGSAFEEGHPMANVETSPNASSVLEVPVGGHAFHANWYLRLLSANTGASFDPKPSKSRVGRLEELPVAASSKDVLYALSDNDWLEYPIFRDGGWLDTDATTNSVVFDLMAGTVQAWVQASEKSVQHVRPFARKPSHTWNLSALMLNNTGGSEY